jgi:hypothetical protein
MNSGNWFKIILRKVWFYVRKLLNYPFVVRKRFDYYNYIVYLIYSRTNERSTLKLRKRNHLLLNVLIFLPLFLGVIYSGLNIYNNKDRYQLYVQRVVLPLKGDTPIKKTFSFLKRSYNSIRYQPIKLTDFEVILYAYMFSILGANLMSKHPAFKKQKEIQDVLLNANKVDEDGNPWKVVWTPHALYFETYQCDVYKFVRETKFWNTINYAPSEPVLIPEDKRKFIIPGKYELPPKIIFKSSDI